MYEELIKALEGCVDCFACTECPIHGSCNGTFDCAAHIAADHIKAQSAEIVSLTAQLAEYQEIGTPFGIKTILAKKDDHLAAKDAEIEKWSRILKNVTRDLATLDLVTEERNKFREERDTLMRRNREQIAVIHRRIDARGLSSDEKMLLDDLMLPREYDKRTPEKQDEED